MKETKKEKKRKKEKTTAISSWSLTFNSGVWVAIYTMLEDVLFIYLFIYCH